MIPVAKPSLDLRESNYVNKAINDGWISSRGEFIEKFENKFAEYCGAKYAVSCNNGTSALHLALLALGINEGDEVIIPALTYIATANAVKYVGAKPVFVDADEKTWNIDANKIEEKITKKTRAIIPVHLYGLPCEMDKIMEIAKKHNLYVIEDCAEAHGAEYKGKKVGTFGDIGCFSFFGNKIITTGEGGMCITSNLKFKDKMKLYKNQGINGEKRYWHTVVGYNYRMTNIQAAIGLAQLEKIEEFINKKIKNAQKYIQELRYLKTIQLPPILKDRKNVYWMFSLLCEREKRDALMRGLENAGIESRPFFYVINKMPPYQEFGQEKFPIAEDISSRGINLPSFVDLTEEEIEKICDEIKKVLTKK